MAWVRWRREADGVGPGYCKSCKKSRNSSAPCGRCPEPELLPENEAAIDLYLSSQTQWVYSGMGQRTGLNYAGVEADARMMRLDVRPEDYLGLKIIEREMLQVDVEQRDKASG